MEHLAKQSQAPSSRYAGTSEQASTGQQPPSDQQPIQDPNQFESAPQDMEQPAENEEEQVDPKDVEEGEDQMDPKKLTFGTRPAKGNQLQEKLKQPDDEQIPQNEISADEKNSPEKEELTSEKNKFQQLLNNDIQAIVSQPVSTKKSQENYLITIEQQQIADLQGQLAEERQRNSKLEERLLKKEQLLNQMKSFHSEICQQFEQSQQEIMNLRKNDAKADTEKQQEIVELKKKFLLIEQLQLDLEKENKLLKQQREQNNYIIKQQEDEVEQLNLNQKIAQDQIRVLEEQVIQLKQENLINAQEQMNLNQEQELHMKIDYLEELNAQLQLKFEAAQEDLKKCQLDKQLYQTQIKELKLTGRAPGNSQGPQATTSQQKQEEPSIETKKKYEEMLNQALTEVHHKHHLQKQQLIAQIKQLQQSADVQKDKQELLNQLKDAQIRIQNLEYQIDQFSLQQSAGSSSRNQPRQQQQLQFSSENVDSALILYNQLTQEFGHQAGDKELLQLIKEQRQFCEFVVQMVQCCHPKEIMKEKPNLKYCWKWLKKILEEYMALKSSGAKMYQSDFHSPQSQRLQQTQQQQQGLAKPIQELQPPQYYTSASQGNLKKPEQELMKNICELLKTDNQRDVINRLTDCLIELEICKRIINKVKRIFGLESLRNMNDLEKQLQFIESQKQSQIQGHSDQLVNL